MINKALKHIRVIVVDDDHFILRQMERMLRRIGIENLTCTDSADQALRYLARRTPETDLLITDLNMPDLDGIELMRHLSSMGLDIAVILMSGEDSRILHTAEQIARERQINILSSLEKPVKQEMLQTLIQGSEMSTVMQSRHPDFTDIRHALQNAVDQQQLTAYYQPQIEIETGRIIGAEALARWQHPERGMISPVRFIPLAEEMNLIGELTRQIYTQAFREVAELDNQGTPLQISVNFSSKGLTQTDTPEIVYRCLNQSGLSPERVTIEVTESMLANDMITSLEILTRFRLKGMNLAIDDFGTGFSTLEQLQKIPFNELKIDRSFVHNADKNKVSMAILESSLNLANRLNLHTVAEGVEDEHDLKLVSAFNCERVQGYYFAKPMSFSELQQWLNNDALSCKPALR